MKLCKYSCVPLCDFCIYFDFNGDEDGVYIGNGYCRKHNKNTEPEDECNDFVCSAVRIMTADEEKAATEKWARRKNKEPESS